MRKACKNIIVITGSVRPQNYTEKAVSIVEDELKKNDPLEFEIIHAKDLKLALPGLDIHGTSSKMLQKKVLNATGIILASPEYHGGISSVMKLIIDNLGSPSALAGKPIVLLGVAAGSIGAIKSLEQLRSICSHVGGIVMPRYVSISNVTGLFDEKGKCKDKEIENKFVAQQPCYWITSSGISVRSMLLKICSENRKKPRSNESSQTF